MTIKLKYMSVILSIIVALGLLWVSLSFYDKEKPEPGEIVLEQDGGVMVYHTFNNDFIEASKSITRVFDTELCVVMYVTASGSIGAPIPLAELRAFTSTALELSQYCKGSFKESAR